MLPPRRSTFLSEHYTLFRKATAMPVKGKKSHVFPFYGHTESPPPVPRPTAALCLLLYVVGAQSRRNIYPSVHGFVI